jgi:hypothetical protein
MYAGLFLAPWMLMYALSTAVMNHRELVQSFYPSKSPAMMKERELDYARTFPATATREEIAAAILRDIGLDGTHTVSGGGRDGRPLVINRQHATAPRRITHDPSAGRIVIEKEEYRTSNLLDRLHRRRGYNAYSLENTWGFVVDAAAVTMAFWCLSGLWLWWELKPTRLWGAISFVAGVGLFALVLALL